MRFIITANQAMDLNIWLDLCELKGISEWAVNEGMDPDTEFEIDLSKSSELHRNIKNKLIERLKEDEII